MSQIEELEQQISQAKQEVLAGDQAIRLASNPEFRKVVIEGYLRDEAARCVRMSTDPNLSEEIRADALRMAQATGYFQRFLQATIANANRQAASLQGMEEMLDQLRANPDGVFVEDDEDGEFVG